MGIFAPKSGLKGRFHLIWRKDGAKPPMAYLLHVQLMPSCLLEGFAEQTIAVPCCHGGHKGGPAFVRSCGGIVPDSFESGFFCLFRKCVVVYPHGAQHEGNDRALWLDLPVQLGFATQWFQLGGTVLHRDGFGNRP